MAKSNGIETPTVNMIGKGTNIKGDIRSDGDFRIDGTLNGTINSNGKIVVGQTGIIKGEINCQNADFSGAVEAIIRVKELLTLKSTSRVNGEVYTGKLAIEPGAKFTGSCNMEDGTKPVMMRPEPKNETAKEKEKTTG